MQKILVPTDFSLTADNALNYAIAIAAKFDSELYLYHVYSFNKKVHYNWKYSDDEQPYIKGLEEKMYITKNTFREKIKENNIVVQTTVEEDSIFSLFNNKVREHGINMIVMGSKGATGLIKIVFGSVAATALKIAKVPVLVIPPEHTFRPLDQIVLATDLNEVTASVLAPLQKLATMFAAKVTILNVTTDSTKKNTQKNNIVLDEVETDYCEIPVSKSVNNTINNFVEKNRFDLMCMIRREKNIIESLLKRSNTLTQVYHNKIPLLVLPG